MSSRYFIWFVAAWLWSGCDRAQPASSATGSARSAAVGSVSSSRAGSGGWAIGSAAGSASGSGAVRGPVPPAPLDIDPILIDAAKAGMSYLVEKAAQSERARAQQVEKLDRKIARIRELLEAGRYDEAELLLVDIYWIPVEPGAEAEAELAATYDAKRRSLAQFLEGKRAPAPVK